MFWTVLGDAWHFPWDSDVHQVHPETLSAKPFKPTVLTGKNDLPAPFWLDTICVYHGNTMSSRSAKHWYSVHHKYNQVETIHYYKSRNFFVWKLSQNIFSLGVKHQHQCSEHPGSRDRVGLVERPWLHLLVDLIFGTHGVCFTKGYCG